MLIDPSFAAPAWLLVRAKPKQERLVLDTLAGRDLEAYCPRVVAPRMHTRAPRVPMPLFPGYIFARCVPRDRFAAANYCPGAIGVVRFGGELAAVEEEFIALLREREGDRGYLVIGDARRQPRAGMKARIVKGPLAGFEGIVQRYMPARDRVRMLLQMVRAVRVVEVDAAHIQTG
jgi:transcription antitermination factor NusG